MDPYYYQPTEPYNKPIDKFAMASMILGICSLATFCTIFLPLVLGALGIIFAVLSKRRVKKMQGSAVTGVITSALGMGVALVFCIISIGSAFILLQPENRDQLNELYESQYGITYEEYVEEIYGEDTLELMDELFD